MPQQKSAKDNSTSYQGGRKGIIIVVLLLLVGLGWFWIRSQRSRQSITPQGPFVIALPVVAFPPVSQLSEGFVAHMKELGYEEGQHVTYLRHEPIQPNPEGMVKIRDVLKGYVQDEVDLIVVAANPDALIALEETKNAGKSIPIVGLDITNPVDAGVAKSFASSENNLTGVYELRSESVGRLLDMMQRVKPGIKKVGFLSQGFLIPSAAAPAMDYLEKLRTQAKSRNIELVEYTTTVAPGPTLEKELPLVLNKVKASDVDAWTHIPGHFIPYQQVLEDEMTKRTNILFASPTAIEVDPKTGEMVGLFSYGVSFTRKGQQGAVLADKVLKGTAPKNIPLEPPDKYDLIINLKVANAIGITIPDAVLELADVIIE